MVKVEDICITEYGAGKGFWEESCRSRRITASTPYGTCTERLSPFGGLLGLIKFLDLIKFEEVFDRVYLGPRTQTRTLPHGGWDFDVALYRVQSAVAFCLYPFGRDGLRADAVSLIGEAKCEGLDVNPSAKFKTAMPTFTL
jgi:hypothetical protein